MVETIRAYARSHLTVLGQQGLSERVLEPVGKTQRHLFVLERSCSIAYADMPLPIGVGQTNSQPFIVALMTELANLAPDDVVLEVEIGVRIQPDDLATLDSWIIDDGRHLSRPQAIRHLVEIALSSYVPRPGTRNSVRATRAAELASKVIDKHLDPEIPAEERDVRRRELLHGPSGFRDVRKDHAG